MRALISVFDKDGLIPFAKELHKLGVEIVSSGGTFDILKKEGIPAISVSDVTEFAECLGGRVKTLHPKIHAGVLANRAVAEDMETIKELGIVPIDLVVVNLYPFQAIIEKKEHTLEEAIENIDIGGPTLLRAAAKNYTGVTVVCDKNDYAEVITRMKEENLDEDYRFSLAKKVFSYTAQYDGAISEYLSREDGTQYPERLHLTLEKKQALRYGENPHQTAAYYTHVGSSARGVEHAKVIQGKELSFNNIVDAQCAIDLIQEFEKPGCVALKHATPCGVAVADTISEAFDKAYEADPVSIFGGIVSFNREVSAELAEKLTTLFLEIIIAPAYTDEALLVFSRKKNLRVLKLKMKDPSQPYFQYKGVAGGFLLQETDHLVFGEENEVVTKKAPTEREKEDLLFAMKVVKHVKSNAIVLVKNGQTVGIGGGEVSRIWAAEAAINRAGEKAKGAVMASDAFFPFPDVMELCADAGITAVIQPGGSKNDVLSIATCDEKGISMVMTGVRHFKH